MQHARRAVEEAELRCRRLRGQQSSGRAQPDHRRVIVTGQAVAEDDGCPAVGPTRDLLELLDSERDTAERPAHVGADGRVPGPFEVGEAERVERRLVDGGNAVVECLSRRELPRPERIHQAAGVPQPGRAHEADSTRAPERPPGQAGGGSLASAAVKLSELTTPALVVEAAALDANLRTMADALPGGQLRPHVKAHKCTALAARQAALGNTAFTCATIREMEGMAEAGLGEDLLLANEVVDASRLGALARRGARVTLAVDS